MKTYKQITEATHVMKAHGFAYGEFLMGEKRIKIEHDADNYAEMIKTLKANNRPTKYLVLLYTENSDRELSGYYIGGFDGPIESEKYMSLVRNRFSTITTNDKWDFRFAKFYEVEQ